MPVALAAGLANWAPNLAQWPVALTAFAVPAATEEIVFRGPLLRWPSRRLAAGLLILFVAWHPVQAIFRPEMAAILLSPAFLILAACLGATATVLTMWTGRLLPAVLLHGTVVALWLLLGGFDV